MQEDKTTAYFAAKWDIKARRVAKLCEQGRIPGAKKIGRDWLIPADAEKPADARIKHGQYIGSRQYQKYIKPNRNKRKDGEAE